jgi:hypothetical protein
MIKATVGLEQFGSPAFLKEKPDLDRWFNIEISKQK